MENCVNSTAPRRSEGNEGARSGLCGGRNTSSMNSLHNQLKSVHSGWTPSAHITSAHEQTVGASLSLVMQNFNELRSSISNDAT